MSTSIVVFTLIKLVGAAYLVYLGVQAIRHRQSTAAAFANGVEPKPICRIMREGFVVGATNPKMIVFQTAILPQFVDHHRGHIGGQLFVLGMVCVAVALLCDSVWALAAGSACAWRSPAARTERHANASGRAG